MRAAILLLGLLFTALLGALTAQDIATYGLTVPSLAGAGIVVLLGVALLGALMHPPER